MVMKLAKYDITASSSSSLTRGEGWKRCGNDVFEEKVNQHLFMLFYIILYYTLSCVVLFILCYLVLLCIHEAVLTVLSTSFSSMMTLKGRNLWDSLVR